MLLQPGLRVLRLDDDTVQLGTDTRWSLRVTGVNEAMLGWLRAGAPPPHRARLSRVDAVACEELLKVLVEAGLAGDPNADTERAPTSIEAVSSSLLFPAGEPNDVSHRRAAARITIDGLCRTGLAIAVGLRAAGVGQLTLLDRTLVSANDLGTGYRTSDISHPRSTSAAKILNDLVPRVPRPVSEEDFFDDDDSPEGSPQLYIVVRHGGISSPLRQELMDLAVPLLPVIGEANQGWLGPLSRPQIGPCLNCVDHYIHDSDPFWPSVREQLSILDAPQTVPSSSVPSYLNTNRAISGLLAAHALGEAIAHVDGYVPVTYRARVDFNYPGAMPKVHSVDPHPNCGCDLVVAAAQVTVTGPPQRSTGSADSPA